MKYLAVALLLSFALATQVLADTLTGKTRVLDGDTLEIANVRVRLAGVDAPETDQLCLNSAGQLYGCGIAARRFVERLLSQTGPPSCTGSERDRYRRLLAVCKIGIDEVNAKLVEAGWALAYVKYSSYYVALEATARNQKSGMWVGAFFAPWDWRDRNSNTIVMAAESVPIEAQKLLLGTLKLDTPPVAGCDIKGNFSSNGQKLYYLPNHRRYGRIKMDRPERRWFCSEDEALAAGWRKAK